MDSTVNQCLLVLLAVAFSLDLEVNLVLLVIDVGSFEDERKHGAEVGIEVSCKKRALESLLVHVLEDDSRRTNNTRDYDSFRAVDYERTTICHDREITEENLLLLNFSALLFELNLHLDRNTECTSLPLALAFALHSKDITRVDGISGITNSHSSVGCFNREICLKQMFKSVLWVRFLAMHDFIKL